MVGEKLGIIILSLILLMSSGGCQKVHKTPGRSVRPGDTDKPSQLPKPGDKIPTLNCELQWGEFLLLQPQGRQTTYQEFQSSQISGETFVVSQSIVSKNILENTAEKITWKKEINVLAPDFGRTETQSSMLKTKFIELCGKGINLTYSDRPTGYRPTSKEDIKFKFKDEDYDVVHEKYVFSKSKLPSDKDEMELWIGTKAPYSGLLFKMQRKFIKTSPFVSENLVSKELQEYTEQEQ